MNARRVPQFSIFFFAADAERPTDAFAYRHLIEAAKYADQHGYTAIWTPERHFATFGGLYPNPSLTSAALAMITSRIQLRAGSVVAPLQNALRIAEEWSVVDNLSGGRVGISFASGWHQDDFVLAPDAYEGRREDLAQKIETVRKLWRGETITLRNGKGTPTPTRVLPRPVQEDLEIWLTCQQDGTFEYAGKAGFNALTNLNRKTLNDLRHKARVYHDAYSAQHGRHGHLSLMCHCFVGTEADHVWEQAGKALQRYLETRLEMDAKLHDGLQMSDADREFLARRGVQRFLGETSLIGTYDECLERAGIFYEHGIDEIACLIDFGVPFDEMMASLDRLTKIKAVLEDRFSSVTA